MIALKRWQLISRRDQLGHIASEIKRAEIAEDNPELKREILSRAFYLIDLSLADSKWRDNPLPLLVLREELAKAYLGEEKNLTRIYAAL